MPLQPDILLHDRYRILGELGHGGMGAVYRGRDDNLGVEVAVKENLFVSPEAERQFKREASLLASLRHPNLPRVTDHFVIPGQGQYLVMDFIPGEDAKQLLDRQKGALPELRVVQWAREILDALNYLHTRPQPIIHRDIKPGNIKITPEGRAVLVDFGLAKVHDIAQATTTGAKALTPGFAPPEQYGMGRTDSRTDLYSLGATLYTLLTDHIPVDSIEIAMGQKKLVPLRELNPTVSEQVAHAVERAMSVTPDDRFATAAEFAAALPAPHTPTQVVPRVTDQGETRLSGEGRGPRAGAGPMPPAHPAHPPTGPRPGTGPRPVVEAPPPAKARGNALIWLVPLLVVMVLLVVVGGAGGALLMASGVLNPARPTPNAPPTQALPPSATAPVVAALPTDTSVPATAPALSLTPLASPTARAGTSSPVAPAVSATSAATPVPAATPLGGGTSGQIAFASDENGGIPQIFIMDIAGQTEADRHVKQLTQRPDGACQPAWSPDGRIILFISPCDKKRDQYPNSALYAMNADGSNPHPFIAELGGAFDPAWSKSGIAFTYVEAGSTPRIYVAQENPADETGVNYHNISASQSADSQPAWSPDGAMIAFVNTSSTGSPVVYWMFKDGKFASGHTLPSPITRDARATSPAWSPDGKQVAFVVNSQIFLVPWDKFGYGAQQRTDAGPNDSPAWSPDGRYLVFESWRNAANHDIYIMNAATGGELTRLTTDPAADFQPAWRP